MKAFVTGGSGFIGRHVIKKLIERGYDVYVLARSDRSMEAVKSLGATAVEGDITDIESMREGMAGSDVVFHIAAHYRLGDPNWTQSEIINVGGTRRVIGLAHELNVPKIVYTSTVGIFGNTKGQIVDETHAFDGPFATEYERTKWLAHHRVVLPLIKKGAPIVIVMPGAVYGPGDTSFIGQLMESFYRGMLPFPFLPGPSTTITYAYVEDVAEGHILAAEKGEVGQSYILAGPAVPLGEMVDFWARLTGKRPPAFHIPSRILRAFVPVIRLVEPYLNLPELYSAESVASLGSTYMARADKARAQLGWKPRSLHTGKLQAIEQIAKDTAENPLPMRREREIATVAIGAAVALLVAWLIVKRKR